MTRVSITRKINVRDPAAYPAWLATASGGSLPGVHEWVEIPNSKLSECPITWGGPGTVPPPNTGTSTPSQAKWTAWNGAALKHSGSVYQIACSGGHGDYAGNEVNAIALGQDTITGWQELHPPSAYDDIINNAEYYLDLTPSSIHTYWALQFDQLRNRLMRVSKSGLLMLGIPEPPSGWGYPAGSGGMAAFDAETNSWLYPGTLAAMPAGGTDYSACCSDPTTGDVYWVAQMGYAVQKYTAATNTWSFVGNSNNGTGYCGMALDHTRGRILKIGGYNDTPSAGYTPKVFSIPDGANIAVTFGGLGEGPISSAGQYPGCVYDSENDCFWVMFGANADESGATEITLYRVDSGTWEVTAPTMSGTIPKGPVYGPMGKLQYAPELGGLVIANRFSENMKFMRTS
jgi:hypothetical protein